MPTPTRVWTVFALLASAVSWAGCDGPTSPTSTASATGLPSGAVLVTAGPTGDYTVRFVADTSCTQIPAALRTRSYPGRAAAETSGLNSRFMMSLSDRNLYEHYSRYWGVAAGDDVRLVIFSWDAFAAWLEDHPIIERVDASAYLAVSGVTTATVSPQRSVDASFEGEFQYCPARVEPTMSGYPPTCAVPLAQCRSSQHRVVVTPR